MWAEILRHDATQILFFCRIKSMSMSIPVNTDTTEIAEHLSFITDKLTKIPSLFQVGLVSNHFKMWLTNLQVFLIFASTRSRTFFVYSYLEALLH